MRDLWLIPTRRLPLAALSATFLLILGGLAVFTASAGVPNPFPAGTGPWINPDYRSDDCPGDQVCAEWPNPGNNTVSVCCIDEATVGTYQDYDTSCRTLLGVRPLT